MQTKHPRILFAADEGGSGDGAGEGGDGTGGDRPLTGAAAASALKKEREERKKLEKEVKDLRGLVETAQQERDNAAREQADKDKSETDKLREAVTRLEQERDQERAARTTAEQDRERVERVRKHAAEFDNADDVVALLKGRGEFDAIESDDDAQRVLAELKRDRPNLLKQPGAPDGLTQILRNGEAQPGQQPGGEGQQQQPDYIDGDKLLKMDDAAIAALKRTNPELYYRSVDKLGQSETVHTTVR